MQEAYVAALKFLVTELEVRHLDTKAEYFSTDFEISAMNAIKEVWAIALDNKHEVFSKTKLSSST